MLHIVLQGKRVIVNGKNFPFSLSLEPLLEKLNFLLSASSGDRQAPPIRAKFLKEFGQSLYQAISPSFGQGLPLHSGPIILDIKERGLSQLPWELMWAEGEWLAKTKGIVRVAGLGKGPRGGSIKGPLKVLVALASPVYKPGVEESLQPDPINLRSQMEIFTQGLSRKRFAATFNILAHITRRRLGDELVKDYHILHFVGHGSRGSLSLEDDYACADEVDSAWLRENLSNSSLHLALFNSCYTASHDPEASCAGIAKTLLDAGIPLVVGMQLAISEGAARAFAHKFYRALAEGKSVVEAMTMARRAIADCAGCRPWEWLTPVLFVQPDALESIQMPFVLPLPSSSSAAIRIIKPKKAAMVGVEGEEFFLDRRRELVEILKTLSFTPYQLQRVVVLKGPAGMGKTALALQAAERMLKRVDRLIWVSGRSRMPVPELLPLTIGNDSLTVVRDEEGLFRQLARKLGVKLKETEDLLLIKERLLRRLGGDKKTLLLLDSMEAFRDSEVLFAFIKQLPLNCCALLTSRYTLPALKARELAVSPFPLAETLKLAHYHLRQPLEESILQQIQQLSGGNPLLIRLFLDHFGGSPQKWFEFREQLSRGLPGYLFDYLFRQPLQLAGKEGRELFMALSLFKPHARPEALAYTCRLTNITCLLERLRSLSLVEVDEEGWVSLSELGRIMAGKLSRDFPLLEKFHRRQALFMARLLRSQFKLLQPQVLTPLVQQVLEEEEFLGQAPPLLEQADSPATPAEQQKMQELLEKTICRTALETMEEEKENALAALAWAAAKPRLPLMYSLVDNLSLFFALRFHWEEMVMVAKMDLQTMRQTCRHKAEAVLLNNLGMAYRHLGNWPLALKCLQEAIKQKEGLGDIYGLAQSYNNLGLLYKSQGEWEKALPIYQRNLSFFHRLGDMKAKANTYNNLGLVYQSQGNWKRALLCYQEALTLKEHLQDTMGVAQTLNNLGLIQQNLGHWQAAEQLYQQALEVFAKLGNTHAAGQTYSNLALLCYDQEQYQPALKFYQQALEIFSQVGDSFGIAQTYNNLGLVYKELGEKERACSFYRQSLELKEELGDLPGLAQTFNNLGVIYKAEQNWEAARDCYRQAIELKYRVGDIQGMGLSYANLGLLELKCQNYGTALKMLERAANIFVKGGDEENLQKVMRALLAVNLKLRDS